MANFAVKLLADISVPEWFAYAFGGGGVGFGYYERRLRKKTIEVQTRHSANLEKYFDKNRRSSRLQANGKNRSEDMK